VEGEVCCIPAVSSMQTRPSPERCWNYRLADRPAWLYRTLNPATGVVRVSAVTIALEPDRAGQVAGSLSNHRVAGMNKGTGQYKRNDKHDKMLTPDSIDSNHGGAPSLKKLTFPIRHLAV